MSEVEAPDPRLSSWLARFPSFFEEHTFWGADGDIPLFTRAGLSDELPPREFISSVRGVCIRRTEAIIHRDAYSYSLLPGGGVEPGEAPEETLVREVAEETGWRVRPVAVIGYLHFRHLGPWREMFRRPFPEFVQPVYAAVAEEFDPALVERDDFVWWSGLAAVSDARALEVWEPGRRFLDAACGVLGRT